MYHYNCVRATKVLPQHSFSLVFTSSSLFQSVGRFLLFWNYMFVKSAVFSPYFPCPWVCVAACNASRIYLVVVSVGTSKWTGISQKIMRRLVWLLKKTQTHTYYTQAICCIYEDIMGFICQISAHRLMHKSNTNKMGQNDYSVWKREEHKTQ